MSACIDDKHNTDSKVIVNTITVDSNMDCQDFDSILVKHADQFAPGTIELAGSISRQLDTFLVNVDTNCLRKQSHYKYFISVILGKLALHHLQCCNQGYDLYHMREGGASIVINEFNQMAGYGAENLEMLNSVIVKDFIEREPTLYSNPVIKKLIIAMNNESSRIEKGIF
jgi:hypothetical protein